MLCCVAVARLLARLRSNDQALRVVSETPTLFPKSRAPRLVKRSHPSRLDLRNLGCIELDHGLGGQRLIKPSMMLHGRGTPVNEL